MMPFAVTRHPWRQLVSATLLALVLSACGGGGGASSSAPVPGSSNTAPRATILLAGQIDGGNGSADVTTATGSQISLDGATSSDADGDALTFRWSIVSKPAGSALALSAETTAQISIKPDVAGTYVMSLKVTDSRGASTEKQVSMVVRQNTAPVTAVVVAASYSATPSTAASRVVTVGAAILLDGSNSRDADGDIVNTSWILLEKPAGSSAALTVANKTARFTADVKGLYKVAARATDPSGAYSETIYPFDAAGVAPVNVVQASTSPVDGGTNVITASVGYVVSFNSADSVSPDGSALSFAWTLVSRPAGSAAALSTPTGIISQLAPDVLGDYVVRLVSTNGSGGSSSYQTTVSVKNRQPTAAISSNAAPVASASGPTLRLPVNTQLTLRGTASSDADGDNLTYLWTLVGKPAGSTVALSSTNASTTQLTTDLAGSYQVRLRVTDPAGAYSEQLLDIASGNNAPVAMIDKERVSVVATNNVGATAAMSFDEDGDALSYSWAIDARPAGSTAAIAAPNAAVLAFSPDVAGTYVASVTVSDGKSSSIAYLTIKALSASTTNVALSFVPQQAKYSRGLDRFVAVAANVNALYIVDPFTGVTRSVALPLAVKSFSLSADGKLAAVLHESVVSLIDLASGVSIRASSTAGSQTEAMVTNAGVIYLVGQTGGQWNTTSVSVIDGRSGVDLTATLGLTNSYSGYFYGTMHGVYSSIMRKGFVVSEGLSPTDINYFTLDTTGKVVKAGDSPYHGDYSISSSLFLTQNEQWVVTSYGTYFRTETLTYGGRLAFTGMIGGFSQSAITDETLLTTYTSNYSSTGKAYATSYKRYNGALFLPASDIALPTIGGLQSYGISIFHSANDNHVALVQTGSANELGTTVQYYLTTR